MNGDILYWRLQKDTVYLPSGIKIEAMFARTMLKSIKRNLSEYESSILEFSTQFWREAVDPLDQYILEKKRKKFFDECELKLKEIYSDDPEIESRIIMIRSCLSRGEISKSDFIELIMCAIDIGITPELIDEFCRSKLLNYEGVPASFGRKLGCSWSRKDVQRW